MSDTTPDVGDVAPDLALPAHPGGEVRLSGLRGRFVVLYFYPRDNTPGCTGEAADFRDAYGDFTAEHAEVLGVSRDSLASHARFAEKQAIPFPLLSDADETACEAYGVIRMKNMYGKRVRGVERSTFLIGPDGRIVRAWRKVRVKGHVDEVLAALRRQRPG